MVATTMPKISSIIEKLEANSRLNAIPRVKFEVGADFHWNHEQRTVFFDPGDPHCIPLLLHETGHAALGHADYPTDMALLTMERAAWDEAKRFAAGINVVIDEELVESSLDSYRDWLHARSTCPNCGAVGVQEAEKRYRCLACLHIWTVNEARLCALRRRDITKQKRP